MIYVAELDDILSVDEVAEMLGVSGRRVEQLINGYRRVDRETGEVLYEHPPLLPARRLGRNAWMIRREDVERLQRERPPGWVGQPPGRRPGQRVVRRQGVPPTAVNEGAGPGDKTAGA